MNLEVVDNWRQSKAVPAGWTPRRGPGAWTSHRVTNTRLLRELQEKVLPGEWRKVYHYGVDGTEIHYFRHRSGKVAGVKHKP